METRLHTHKSRLIVALDLPDVEAARQAVIEIGDAVCFYKVGYQLVFAGGLVFVRELLDAGHRVFLDMKLLDIDNTVGKGVENIARLGVSFLTLHAYPKAMAAAVAARGSSDLKLLGVTVLTSMDDRDLRDAGYGHGAAELVAMRAEQVRTTGMDGIICAPTEAAAMRTLLGPDHLIVTPGIRPGGSAADDQKRIMTPADAIAAGVDHMVVGRPIVATGDRRRAALAIQDEIAGALVS